MNQLIQYLNTDLDLESTTDLSSLAATFAAQGVFALHVTQATEGEWYAIFETDQQHEDPEANIGEMLYVIERLDATQRSIWDNCKVREFNVGYDCGEAPWAYNQGLSNELLRRLAAADASLRWTLYPARDDDVASSGEQAESSGTQD